MTEGVGVLVGGDDDEVLAAVVERLRALDGGLDVSVETERAAALERLSEGTVDCLVTIVPPDDTTSPALVARASDVDDVSIVVVARNGGTAPGAALDAGAAEFVAEATATGAPRLLARRIRSVVEGSCDLPDDRPADLPVDRPADRPDDQPTDRQPLRSAGRSILDRLATPVWVLRDGEVVDANPACTELLGTDREALVGTPVTELVVPSDRETIRDHCETLAGGERAERTDEVSLVGPWNERMLVEVAGRRVDDGGAVAGTLARVSGVRLAERRFGALFEHLEHPVAEVDLDGGRAIVRRLNPAFEDVFGVTADDLAGAALDEHVVPADDDVHERALDVYVRAERGTAVSEVVVRTTADGPGTFQLQAIPYEGLDGKRAILVYADVSERTDRERRLTEIQRATRALLEAADRGAVARIGAASVQRLLDVRVVVVYGYDDAEDALVPHAASDGARALFGEVPTVARGDGPTWYVYQLGEPLRTDDIRSMHSIDDPDRPVRSELLVPVGDHGVLVAGSTEVGVFDEADEALARTLGSTLEVAFDRAEREALLRERERELRRQNERLEEFAGIVSHDLRSPLTVVKGNASLLRESGDVEYLDRIERAADRMDTLIEDVLALARHGRAVDEPELLDLQEVVENAWATADTRSATLDADVDASIEADPGRLEQLLGNLFRNAVEHGGDDVTVCVEVLEGDAEEHPGGRYGRTIEGFAVADDGPGLPEEEPGELFQPGVTTDEDGTGFGLAIVHRIAEAHGWDVTAGESESGGARFALTDVDGT